MGSPLTALLGRNKRYRAGSNPGFFIVSVSLIFVKSLSALSFIVSLSFTILSFLRSPGTCFPGVYGYNDLTVFLEERVTD